MHTFLICLLGAFALLCLTLLCAALAMTITEIRQKKGK